MTSKLKKKKRRPASTAREERIQPTPERLRQASNDDVSRVGPITRVDNHPLDRLHNRRDAKGNRLISERQHAAGKRLEQVWRRSGFSPRVTSTLAPRQDPDFRSGDRRAEAAAEYIAAIRAVGVTWSWAVCAVCLEGLSLSEAASRQQKSVNSASDYLRDGLTLLADHWGL